MLVIHLEEMLKEKAVNISSGPASREFLSRKLGVLFVLLFNMLFLCWVVCLLKWLVLNCFHNPINSEKVRQTKSYSVVGHRAANVIVEIPFHFLFLSLTKCEFTCRYENDIVTIRNSLSLYAILCK